VELACTRHFLEVFVASLTAFIEEGHPNLSLSFTEGVRRWTVGAHLCTRWSWLSSWMRWKCARQSTPLGVAARAAARCTQCRDVEEECERGESDVEEEKDDNDIELCALKVVAVKACAGRRVPTPHVPTAAALT